MGDPFGPIHLYLESIGKLPDEDIPLADAALALAVAEMPGLQVERYRFYLDQLVERVKTRQAELLGAGAIDDVRTELAALKHVIADQDGFAGDVESYDHLDNANLIRTIDRRRGLPITIAIIYIDVGRRAGFDVSGLRFPGHFLIRLRKNSDILIVDVSGGCAVLRAPEMRTLLKKFQGDAAELSADYYQPALKRDTLIRLQNNIKLRQIAAEDYESAVRTIERMRLIDRQEFRLLLDAGVLYARLGQPKSAIQMIEDYVAILPLGHRNRPDALAMLNDLRNQIQ
jgi:regulator of sirC expression with transglutaminase-like and TPR domain